jgi:hypothetical protein
MSKLFTDSEMADNSPIAIKPNDSPITRKAKKFARSQTISYDSLAMSQAYEIGARSMRNAVQIMICNACPNKQECNTDEYVDDCELYQGLEKIFGK